MDSSPSFFNLPSLLKTHYTPTILVVSSIGAEKHCLKNDTSISQILSKFGRVGYTVRVNSINEQAYDIRGLQVRFVTLPELEKNTAKQNIFEKDVSKHLHDVVSAHSSCDSYSQINLRSEKEALLLQKDLEKKDPTPWFQMYRWEYIRMMGISEMEFFNHPVVCLTVISSDSTDPCKEASSLFDEQNLPSVFQKGTMHPDIPRFFLVLHDQNDTKQEKFADCLNQLKSTFQKDNIYHLSINSLLEKNLDGSYLSSEDHQQIESFVSAFITRGIIPELQKTIQNLHNIVETSKKGIKNQLKGWFGIGKKSSKNNEKVASVIPEKTIYPLNSIESSQKRLADFLFMIQDYSEAFNIYKNSLRDYSSDKSWKYLAATSEMCGLCLFMFDPSKKEIETYFENSWQHYMKDSLFRYAIRTTLFFTEILKIRKNIIDMTHKFIRAADAREADKLTAALLNEQAAFCFLQMNPPQFRKYSMRLFCAGNFYQRENLISHSFRCYSSIYSNYEFRHWGLIDEYMHHTLAKQSFLLERFDEAINYIDKLMTNILSETKHNEYMKDFLDIHRKIGEKKGIAIQKLPLPRINDKSVTVFLSDYPPKSPLQDLWNQMKRDLKHEKEGNKFRFFQKLKKSKPKVAVVQEVIYLEVEISNPLSVQLEFSDMKLMAFHEKDGKESSEESFQVFPFDLQLKPYETKKQSFSIRSIMEGTLKLNGISFLLNKTVRGYNEFSLPKRRLNQTQEQQKGVHYEQNFDLTFKITKPMPLLEVEVQQFPQTLFQGEFYKLDFILKNSGTSPLRSVKVKLNFPTFFYFENDAVDDGELSKQDHSIIHITLENGSLNPNESVKIPVWMRCHKSGTHLLHFLFYYESEIPNPEMKYRLTRFSNKIKVMRSLKLTKSINASHSNITSYLLNLQISNIQDSTEFKLEKLVFYGSRWTFSPLSMTTENIKAGESINLIFRVIPKEQAQDEFILDLAQQSDEIYPHLGFLSRERSYNLQKKKTEPSDSNIQFILLWKTNRDQNFIRGQSNLCDVSLETHFDSEVPAHEDFIRFSIESPRTLSCDFSTNNVKIVPVKFWISNSSDEAVSFYLEALKPHEHPDPSSGEISHFFWGGSTRFFVENLQPEKKLSLGGYVVLSSPGIHNLNKYRLSLKDPFRNDVQRILSPLPHIIFLEDTSTSNM